MDNSEKIVKITKRLIKEYPESKCSLIFSNPFELLVGTILSAQSTDERVNMILPDLITAYPSAELMSRTSIDQIKPYIKSVGLYNNKAKSLFNMSNQIMTEYDGKVPNEMKELVKLAGVGRKTANVVLGNAFQVPDSGIAVDTHVTRLTGRMGFTDHTSAVKIEKDLMKILPVEYWVDFTHLIIDHGRKICVRHPRCQKCILEDLCPKIIKIDKDK